MTAAMDPYGVLGLQPGASQAEIKRAYRRLAKALHPDSAGERSLPAFLAVQDAYERLTGTKVRTVRPPAPATPTSAGAFREPWRADPARARAAREQARTRARAGGSAGPGAAGSASGHARDAGGQGAWARTDQQARATAGTGTRAGTGGRSPGGRTTRDTTGNGAPADGTTGSTGRRRRSTRKATMGSTSYDEARDATDPRWAGASWYGPTTGEYWIVNPREYADPRKHGPGYSSRLRTGPRDESAEASPDETGRTAASPAAAGRPVAQASSTSTGAPAPETRTPAPQPDEAIIDAIVRPGSPDPLRRLGIVLLAWAPVGIAATAVIGQVTGCASFSAACDGTDPFLPWVAQAIIVGLLLVASPLARLFAAGTLGLLVGLVPATGFVIALGGAGSAAAPPVLAAVLAIAWLIGAAWGLRRVAAARRAGIGAGTPGGTS